MKITKEKNDVVVKIPFSTKRYNPYSPEQDVGEHNTLVGLISKDQYGCKEIGFAYVIDMDYKGKDDQFSDIIIRWDGDEEEFKNVCKKLKIACIEI